MYEKHRIDSEGKIFIPEKFRDVLKITDKTDLTISLMYPNRIIIELYEERCRFCGAALLFRDPPLCPKCLLEISSKINSRPNSYYKLD